ncbi:tetratricopeptide repeat protein [Streptosporangium sp. NPDC051023]|uniref:tetratricopeptide repeat protein n=1 Tax=Streptosporangium sp. NPDC051023 TaxID=3155410 RepID=UPI00344EB54F
MGVDRVAPEGGQRVQAYGHAQQAAQYGGTQINNFGGREPQRLVRTPDTLVPPPVTMVGREAELDDLLTLVDQARSGGRPVVLSAVHGMGGIGKTALVRALTARVRDRFADARIELDLFGFTPGEEPRDPGDVLSELLGLVGFPASEVPADVAGKSQLWRAWLADRQVLLVFDNARNADQVRPLLPGHARHCLVLVTSRNRLDGLDAHRRVQIEALPEADAVALLAGAAGREEGQDRRTLAELARLCGFLPLALRPVGALLAELDPADLLETMSDTARPLRHIRDGERETRAAFELSYRALEEDLRELLDACAAHPGPDFDAASVGALAALPRPVARVGLAELAKRSMLVLAMPGRYTFHDLFLGYAREAGAGHDAAWAGQARARLYRHLYQAADGATEELLGRLGAVADARDTARSGRAARARAWLVPSTGELRACCAAALDDRWERAAGFVKVVGWWLLLEGRADQADALHTAAYDVAREMGNPWEQASALYGLAGVEEKRARYGQAVSLYRQALVLYEEVGDRQGQISALCGLAEVVRLRDDHDQAAVVYQRALELSEESGDLLGQADALCGLADVARLRDDYGQAGVVYRRALALYEEVGDRLGQANALRGVADVDRLYGEHDSAVETYRRALELFEEIGDRRGQADVLRGVAEAAKLHGDYDSAVETYRRALELFEEIGDRPGQASTLRGVADVARLRGEHDSAVETYRRALPLYEGDALGQASVFLYVAQIEVARGRWPEARQAYHRAAKIYASAGFAHWAELCESRARKLG